ncbi:MAG: succinate dehydrogenase, cytochrome b556 subunit [Candidatus Azosocius agrarius]|nr:MAG: succinate dehydrogenase, cytochrome b556 subunit [Gammaproteobacteria bacterium]
MKQKPKNLNLFNLKLSVMALVSILHRISGILLFLLIPCVLFILKISLASEVNFIIVKNYFSIIFVKICLIFFLSLLIYHLFAGIRHIFMDFGMWENKKGGIRSAKGVLYFFSLFVLIMGVFIW